MLAKMFDVDLDAMKRIMYIYCIYIYLSMSSIVFYCSYRTVYNYPNIHAQVEVFVGTIWGVLIL